jgi:hypothetical protein
MRKLFGVLAASALLFAGSTATAAPVATTASLVLTIQNVGSLTITGAGSVNVSGSTVTMAAGLVAQGTAPIVIVVTGTTAVQSLTAVGLGNGAGTFIPGGGTASGEGCAGLTLGVACNQGGGIGGSMALLGTIFVRINAFVIIPVNLSTNLIGQGGSFITPKSSISGDAGLWTNGVAQVNGTTDTPSATGVTTAFTSPGSPSPLVLVTPTFVNAFTGLAFLPLFSTLTLNDVSIPEPGTLLLLASGVAGLALVGRRRS